VGTAIPGHRQLADFLGKMGSFALAAANIFPDREK